MYTRAQKESSSVSSTSIHKKSNNSESSRYFSVQRQPEINSSQEKERPSYSRNAADLLAANVMRSMAARAQGEEAQGHKGQEESGAASVAQVVMPKPQLPIAPAASVSQPLGAMGKQMQCSACQQGMEFGKDSDEMSSVAGVQTKLTVGAPGDRYEQEADQVAAQVMRMSIPPDHSPQVQRFGEEDNPVQMWSLAQSITPLVHRRVDEHLQMRSLVQRAFQSGGNQASGDLESRLNASKAGGSALAPEVRAFMEPRFGADFSSVRVHTGSEAVQMSQELGAQAFAQGSDVYFGAGKSPGNNELTAHELTHVVQQTGGVQRKCSECESELSGKEQKQPISTLNEVAQGNKKPQDIDENEAANIGKEAVQKVSYDKIIEMATKAGLIEKKADRQNSEIVQRQLLAPEDRIFRQAAAPTFWEVFRPFLITGGAVSQADSPVPGPADLVGLGIIAAGLVAAGVIVLASSQSGDRAEPLVKPKKQPRFPGGCDRETLISFAKKCGMDVQPGGNHYNVFKNGQKITQIPHTVKENGTCKAIIDTIAANCY